jgi:hypothetical protein
LLRGLLAKIPELACVEHSIFGVGFVLGERVGDIGPLRDVWFVSDEKVRAILPEYLFRGRTPDTVSKAFRGAYSAYKKSRVKKRLKPGPKPRPGNEQECWRKTFEFTGREDELVERQGLEEVAA